MVIYFSIFFIICFLSFLECSALSKKNSVLLFFFALLLIFIASYFKPLYSTTDDYAYYNHLVGYDDGVDFELGYRFLINLLQVLNLDEYGFLTFIIVFISLVIKMLAGFNRIPYLILPLLVYTSHFFLYQELTQIRSALASSLTVLSIFLWLDKLKIVSLLIFLLALTFHKAVILFIPAFFILNVDCKLNLVKLFFLILISAFISFFMKKFILWIGEGIIPDAVFNTYFLDEAGFSKAIGILNPATVKYIFFSFVFVWFLSRIKDSTYLPLVNLYTFGTLWIIIFASFGTLAGRGAFFYTIYEMFLVSILMKAITDKLIRIVALASLMLVYTIILFINLDVKNVLVIP
ncbi:EpsG family protein [bacterium 19NY03SH02]|uniref:EpsG family protein n=1 Tax=bacterium 19NY03SH02 TaxID=2920631 RepID=A0AAU6UZL0_UNCXX|nr:EpsG family protein [Shewanella chilikensis]